MAGQTGICGQLFDSTLRYGARTHYQQLPAHSKGLSTRGNGFRLGKVRHFCPLLPAHRIPKLPLWNTKHEMFNFHCNFINLILFQFDFTLIWRITREFFFIISYVFWPQDSKFSNGKSISLLQAEIFGKNRRRPKHSIERRTHKKS